MPLGLGEGLGEGDALFHPRPASPIKGEELRGLNGYALPLECRCSR
jgi:hypothetical protein